MKNFIFAGLLFIGCNLMGQTLTPDTLVKLGGIKIPVYVRNITSQMVYYSPLEKPKDNLKIDRKDLEKVLLKNGRVEVFNKPAFTLISEGQWEAVLITHSEKEVEGMYKRKFVTSKSSPTKSKKKAKENAIIKLQKLAANAGGSVILITHEEFFGGYGDNPGYYLEGIAYGFEPLEEGTDVIVDPSKKNDQPAQKTETKAPVNQSQNKTQQSSQQKTNTSTSAPQKTGTTAVPPKTTITAPQQKTTPPAQPQKTGTSTPQKSGTTQK